MRVYEESSHLSESEAQNKAQHAGNSEAHNARQHRSHVRFVGIDDPSGGRDLCAVPLCQRPGSHEREAPRGAALAHCE